MKPVLKYYLLAYNAIAFLAWLVFAILFITRQWFTALIFLNIAQGLAILEVIHAVLGWVRSPIGSTAAQVASRLLVLVLLNLFLTDADQRFVMYGTVVVSFAWTVTELVRYSFYFLGLLDRHPRSLLWMRYSFFILLYPIGVTGEWLIMLSPIIAYGFTGVSDIFIGDHQYHLQYLYYSIFLGLIAISYIYYFPVLYGYMWRQRRSKLLPAAL